MFSKVNCDDIFMKALHFERMYGNQEELESTVSSIAKKQEENIRKEQKEAAEKEKAQKRAEKQSKKIGKKEFKVMRFHFIPFFSCFASRKKVDKINDNKKLLAFFAGNGCSSLLSMRVY